MKRDVTITVEDVGGITKRWIEESEEHSDVDLMAEALAEVIIASASFRSWVPKILAKTILDVRSHFHAEGLIVPEALVEAALSVIAEERARTIADATPDAGEDQREDQA